VPRNRARLFTAYDFQEPSLKGLKIGGGYTYHGSQPVFDQTGGIPGALPLAPGWGTVDLLCAYTFDLDGVKTTAQINASNIFHHNYITNAVVPSRTSPGYTFGSVNYGAAPEIRGSLRFEF